MIFFDEDGDDEKRTTMDILTLSNISGYVYFYDDRVSLAIAFNVSDATERASLGIVEKGMTHEDMEMAVNLDAFLILRYLHIRRGVSTLEVRDGQPPSFIQEIFLLDDCYHRRIDDHSLARRGYKTLPKNEEVIVLTAYDRYRGHKAVTGMVPYRTCYVPNQVTWYYHGMTYKYDAAYRNVLEDVGFPLHCVDAPTAMIYISYCVHHGKIPTLIDGTLACNRDNRLFFMCLIDELYNHHRVDIIAAIIERWPDAKKEIFWMTDERLKKSHPEIFGHP